MQQYKFIRLDRQAPYEPLILCLKGLQLAYNPGDYLSAEQMQQNPRLHHHYQELKEWAHQPDSDWRADDPSASWIPSATA